VVHLNGYAHGALPWHAAKVVVGHSCVLSWWRAVHGEPAPAQWDRYRWAVAAGLRAADVVIAPTQSMLNALQENYGVGDCGLVIPNGRRWSGQQAMDKQPLILTAGRLWDEAKNAAMLASIAPELPWPVYLAGEAQHPARHDASERTPSLNEPPHQQLHFLGRLTAQELWS
jgi:glycogen synthase